MEKIEITSMSSRGQVVIPQSLREKFRLKDGEKFIVVGSEETILLKKIKMPSWDEVTRPFKESAKKTGLKEKDVVDIIHRFRKQNKK